MRGLRAVCASLLLSAALAGCGGGGGVVENSVANDTAPTSPTGTATLSWDAPTAHVDGSGLTDLAGYIIYYGTDVSAMTQTIQVSSPTALGYVVSGLAMGTTWYFSVSSYTTGGEESAHSAVVSKSI